MTDALALLGESSAARSWAANRYVERVRSVLADAYQRDFDSVVGREDDDWVRRSEHDRWQYGPAGGSEIVPAYDIDDRGRAFTIRLPAGASSAYLRNGSGADGVQVDA